MTTAKQIKILVLDLTDVDRPSANTIQELRNLVCDGWLYGFKDGSKLTSGEAEKMGAYINIAAKKLRYAA